MRHLSLPQLSASVDDSLSGVSLEIVERHLAECDDCRARQQRLHRVDALLVQMIRFEPSETWLEKVAGEIAVRLRDETLGAPGRFAGSAPPPNRVVPVPQAAPVASVPSQLPLSPPPPPPPPPPSPSAAMTLPRSTLPPDPLPDSPPRPARAPAGETPRWRVHSERIARARRDAADKPRATMLPLISGLAGGALAGALVVTLVFGPRTRSHPQRPVAMPTSSGGSSALTNEPLAPEVTPVRMSATAPPAAPPVAPPSAKPATSPSPAPPAATANPSAARRAATPVRDEDEEADWPMLCGIVLDETGGPVSGARVLLADLDLGARTDRRGRFCLSGPAGDRTMSVMALGFATHRQLVTLTRATADLSVVLKNAR